MYSVLGNTFKRMAKWTNNKLDCAACLLCCMSAMLHVCYAACLLAECWYAACLLCCMSAMLHVCYASCLLCCMSAMLHVCYVVCLCTCPTLHHQDSLCDGQQPRRLLRRTTWIQSKQYNLKSSLRQKENHAQSCWPPRASNNLNRLHKHSQHTTGHQGNTLQGYPVFLTDNA